MAEDTTATTAQPEAGGPLSDADFRTQELALLKAQAQPAKEAVVEEAEDDEGEGETEDTTEATDESEPEEKVPVDAKSKAAIKENQRLREKNREKDDELAEMRRRLDELSRKVEEKPKAKEVDPSDKLQKASLEELWNADDAIGDALAEAKQEGDTDQIAKLKAARMKIRMEIMERPARERDVKAESASAAQQWSEFEATLLEHYPEIKQEDSALYQAAQKFYDDHGPLMKKLGQEVGGMVSILSAVMLQKPGKKAASPKKEENVVKEIEKIVEASTSKTPSNANHKDNSPVNVEELSKEEFDKVWQKMKNGQLALT